MTKPPDDSQTDLLGEPGDHSLREQLFRDLSGGECVPLSHIDFFVAKNHPTEPLGARQSRVIDTIESLLNDGLLVIGDVVGGGDDYVEPWKMSTGEALARLRDEYVTHYDNEVGWSWTTWFALTPQGERVAEEVTS